MTTEQTGRVIALDVGGTSMKGAILGADDTVERFLGWPTPREDGPGRVVDAVLVAVDELMAQAPDARAIGLVVPGLVDDRSGVALYSENIGWRDVAFRALVADRTGLPVGFGHDVRAGGLAERALGAARGVDELLFMPIGTGISGAMYVEGRLVENKYAGEIGHLDVGSGLACVCGAVGCLETVATGPSIARRYNELAGASVSGAKPVVDRMGEGDQIASRVWAGAVEALASALTAYVTLLAPERVVLGGGVSGAGELLLAPLREALGRRLVWQPQPQLVRAALGENAACLGAGLLAREALATAFETTEEDSGNRQ
ncbi:ROK family protein [Parafrigoribacterium soli]|uniref:ROK family protein n=1 Tax=Parafrigoribacterium soli TaxID=3144663 RepID=UPI0032EC1C5E